VRGPRFLDLACGTGQVAFALAPYAGEVLAVDQEVEAVALGRRKAQRLGVANTRWLVAGAEEVGRVVPHLAPGGGIALLWGGDPWGDGRDWQGVLRVTLDRWQDTAGTGDRVPAGWWEAIDRIPATQVLRRAGRAYEGKVVFRVPHTWGLDDLVGYVYSTSYLSLRARLLACRPGGEFEQDLSYAYEYARR
jgi:SAM-dependent methyltransferase